MPHDRNGKDGRRPVLFWAVVIAAAIGVTALFAFLVSRFPGTLQDSDSQISLVYNLGWLALLMAGGIAAWRARPGMALRHVAWWLIIAGVVAGLYAYRDELTRVGDRLMTELVPGHGRTVSDGRGVTFRAASDGHFYVDADVEGRSIRFLVDTGASMIVLTLADARRLNLDVDRLSFSVRTQTANGTAWNALVRLNDVTINAFSVRNIQALVSQSEMPTSLLGVNYLERLNRYEISGDYLTFYH